MSSENKVKVVRLIETSITKRGSGSGPNSPIRVVTQWWTMNGELVFEIDPCAITKLPEDDLAISVIH